MIASIQYGGRITDDFDRQLMEAYAQLYYREVSLCVGWGWGVGGQRRLRGTACWGSAGC
jgi:hypothetical protein